MSNLIEKQAAIEAVGLNTWAGSRISQLPTVEAIPIEWLDMFMQRYKIQGDDEYKLLHFMVTEWKKWEKENEKQTVG